MFDQNDPATWPSDIEELVKLAEESEKESSQPDVKLAEETPAEEPKPEETVTPEPEEAPAEEPVAEPEPEVLTKDGKNVIPYDVLQKARNKSKTLEAKLAEMQAQLDTLQKQTPQQAAATNPQVEAVTSNDIPEAIQLKADQIKENWGEGQAELYLEHYKSTLETKRLQDALKAQADEIAALKDEWQGRQQREQRTEEEQIQEAIDNSPLMAQWEAQADENPEWWNRSLEMHKMLQATNEAYAQKPWSEKFAELPELVQKVYGAAPNAPAKAPAAKPAAKPTATQLKEAAAEKIAAAANAKVPTSMGDIPGGETPAVSEVERLEQMTPSQLEAHMAKLAKDPKALDSFLYSIS